MAKIVEDVLVIKFSKLVKDSGLTESNLATEEIQSALEQVCQELLGEHVIVEVEKLQQ
jgi:hypothetical protein